MQTKTERELLIKAYESLPTGNISDAMDELNLPRSALEGLKPISVNQRRVVGFALTIQQMRRRQPTDKISLARHGTIIDEQVTTGDIIVIDTSNITNVSTGGSLQLLRAKVRGAAGYITNGCLRDISEIIELDLPVYYTGSIPVKSSLDIETVGVNVPVFVGGIQIRPKDLIVMDDTGVMAIPIDWAQEVLRRALIIQRKEDAMMELIKKGRTLAEARKLSPENYR